MKPALKLIIFVAVLAIFFKIVTSSNRTPPTVTEIMHDDSIPAMSPPLSTPAANTWSYTTDSDKMTSKIIYYASLDANDKLYLKFPYDGGVTASINVRYQDGENDAWLEVSKGQFLANAIRDQNIKVRFDSSKAITYSCGAASDGSTQTLFIPATSFIQHLKNARHLVIQAQMYDNGVQEMEFNTQGFTWSKQ